MRQLQKIDGARTSLEQRCDGGACAVRTEVAKKRIAGAKGQKAQRNAVFWWPFRENAVEHLVGRPIAAYRQESAIALSVRLASQLHGMAGRARSDNVNRQAPRTQLRQLWAGEFGGATATSRGIHDGDETFHA